MPSIKSVRSQIDEIDARIVALLADRLRNALEIGRLKRARSLTNPKPGAPVVKVGVFASDREEEVFRRLHRISDSLRLPWPLVQAVFTDVVSLCRAGQGKVTAHVLGPPGTHSEWAARARFGAALVLKHHESIPRAIKAAEQAAAHSDVDAMAVVPVENSQEGTVVATVDALLAASMRVVGEGYYRVRHALLSKASSVSEVKVVYSHAMGLAQCGRWLQENAAHAKQVEVASTAEAARQAEAAASARGVAAVASPYWVSWASRGPAARSELRALAMDIQNSLDNTTRFLVLGARESEPTGDDKTSLVFSLPNKSGSLSQALDVFARHRINMTKIESRPQRGLQWEYLFFVDLDGHARDAKLKRVLEMFGARVRTFKVLGAYPKGRTWN